MGHLGAGHPNLDFPTDPRPLVKAAALERRLGAYFPPVTMRAAGVEGILAGRPLLVAQAQESDADRIAVDLALKLPGRAQGSWPTRW